MIHERTMTAMFDYLLKNNNVKPEQNLKAKFNSM